MYIQNSRNHVTRNKTQFAKNLLKWFARNAEIFPWRKTSDPYKVMISEMLLRRTRASSVLYVYEKFIRKFPNAKTLAESNVNEIRKVIRPLGMIGRAANLKHVACKITSHHVEGFPSKDSEMQELIGPQSRYTINAIRCFAWNERVPVFDANVKRIFERVFSIHFGTDAHKRKESWELALLLLPRRNVKEYNWGLLDPGRLICTPARPHCAMCPLKSICDYAKANL